MRKRKPVFQFIHTYFDPKLDLRVQAFNLLALAGMMASIAVAAVSLAQNAIINACICFLCFLTAFGLVRITGKRVAGITIPFRFSCWFIVVLVFMVQFPILFFAAGGYRSGMPNFFVFALVFTALMLDHWERVTAIAIQFALYISCVWIAYRFPATVIYFETELDFMADVVIGIVVAGGLILSVILLYIRIYRDRQKRLAELDRLKTEFFSNMSHDLKTPLTVISTEILNATDQLYYDMDKDDMRESLENAQREIMRMARMIESTMKHSAMQRNTYDLKPIEIASVLREGAATYSAILERQGNTLILNIPDILPCVYGNADTLLHVLSNLLSNANRHTRNGEIAIRATAENGMIKVWVQDNGEGVKPTLLPRVFERGVSENGSGIGLHICKSAIESHNGAITMESERGQGTTVTFTLPVYHKEVEASDNG